MKNYAGEYIYHLPWYDKENITFIDMARVIELSYRFLEKQLEVVERNLFIDTAIEALPIFQRDLGLQISSEVPLEQRRKIIQGYLHYLHEQTTEVVVLELMRSYVNEHDAVDIKKTDEQDVYEVTLVYRNTTVHNEGDLIDTLEKVLPSHLAFTFRLLIEIDLALETRLGDYNYPIHLCGLYDTGTIPRIRWEGQATNIDVNLDTAIDDAKNYKPLAGERHTATQLNNDKVTDTINMTSFGSDNVYSFEK